MRWLVEVTSLGTTEKESLHVDAETWQKALHAARAQRGEPGPMSGFSIELLDEGCRAVDPTSRTRYEVRRAPDAARTSVAPPPPAQPVAAPATSAVPRPVSHAPPPVLAPGPVVHAPAAPRAPTPPRAPAPAQAPAQAHAPTPVHAPAPVRASTPPPAPTPAVAQAPAAAPVPATLRADVAANVPSQIVFKREQDATEAMPLTYREYVYNVPPGTSEASAETLLLTQLEFVRASLERVPAGKLVNLAAVDTPIEAKPAPPPLATLAWKDWRGAPAVSFPRRPGHRPAAPPAPAFTAPAAPAFAPPPAPVVAPAPAAAPVFAPPPAPVFAPPPAPVFAPPPAPVFAPPPAPVFAPPPAPVFAPPPAPVFAPPPAPAFAPPPAAAFAPAPGPAPAFAPGFAPPFASPAAQPFARPSGRAPSTPGNNGRVRGEDLIADLFEAMHDLHFLRDAVEGGDFCLALAMEKLPSQTGIVHLYDINHREFLITSTRGGGSEVLLAQRFPESDPILAAAMSRRRPIVFADAAQSEAASVERYSVSGGPRSVIVAPVMQAGRFLGAIELLNPLDGQPFTEAEGNAVMYIADQLAEFVGQRGVVTDPERIATRQTPGE